jgi:hypothetical protein
MNKDDSNRESEFRRDKAVGGEVKKEAEARVGADAELDVRLDEALALYANVDPRVGLEGRVLARLAEARRESRVGRGWWAALALGMAAALIVIFVWVGLLDRNTNRPTAATVAAPHAAVSGEGGGGLKTGAGEAALSGSASAASTASASTPAVSARATQRKFNGEENDRISRRDSAPKLEQFPSAAPLNEQEELLARYVRDFPERATLMARAQTELRKQDELEMAVPWPAKAGDGTEERE